MKKILKDKLKEREKEKIDKGIKAAKPMDAEEILKYIMNELPKKSEKEKDDFRKIIHDSFVKAGNVLIERAIIDKILTEKEYISWKKKYKIDVCSMQAVLQAYYGKKDGHFNKKENLYVTTTNDSTIANDSFRKLVKKKFGVEILTMDETYKKLKEEDPAGFKMGEIEWKKKKKEMKK